MRSGLAEIYKHGLIADPAYWNKLIDFATLTSNDLNQIIHESVVIKTRLFLRIPQNKMLERHSILGTLWVMLSNLIV